MSNPPMMALVVEDDRSWQGILTELLTDAGLQVETASTLEQALPLIRARAHRIAVLDLSLEGSDPHNRDGLQVLEAVRRSDPGCAAILLTGFATVELAVNVLTEAGAFSCLRKEAFSRAQFRELVQKALRLPPQLSQSPNEPDLPAALSPVAPVPAGTPSGGTALVAEDDAGWRSILTELLSGGGYRVLAAAGFGEALGLLRREKFNLAIVDLTLTPGLPGSPEESQDGRRLLSISRTARIPTIVLSGTADPDGVQQTFTEYEVFAYLAKQTFDRRAFLQTVQAARSSGPAQAGELNRLTDREWEVLELLAQGMTNKEIASRLVITTNTVKRHLKSIFEKLDIHTRAAAAAKAARLG